jgi:hypothetical protein
VEALVWKGSSEVTHGYRHDAKPTFVRGGSAHILINTIKKEDQHAQMINFLTHFEQQAKVHGCKKVEFELREVIAPQFRSPDYWKKFGYQHQEFEEMPDFSDSTGASPITVKAEKDLPESKEDE